MYSNEKNNTLNLKDLFIKIIFMVLFVLLLVWLFPKVPNMTAFYSNVFRENISYMQNAAESYFTEDRLPKEVGETVEISLQDMYDKNIALPFVDENGESCNVYSSYAQITKNASDYTLKVNLECNTEKHHVLKTVGCNQYCDTDNCNNTSKTDDTKETSCGDLQYQYKKESGTKKITSYSCPSGYSRSGKYCYKTSNTGKTGATEIYSKDKTIIVNALKNPGTEVKVELEVIRKKSNDTYSCSEGTLSGTECIITKNATKITTGGGTYTYNDTVPYTYTETKNCNCRTQTVNTCASISGCFNYVDKTVCDKCTVEKTGTQLVAKTGKYPLVVTYSCLSGFDKSGTTCKKVINANVTIGTTTYSCPTEATSTTGSNESLKCFKTTAVEGKYYCEDANATLEESSKTCSKVVKGELTGYKCPSSKYILDGKNCYIKTTNKKKATAKTTTKTVYEYKWSCKSSLEDGWTKTGKTR